SVPMLRTLSLVEREIRSVFSCSAAFCCEARFGSFTSGVDYVTRRSISAWAGKRRSFDLTPTPPLFSGGSQIHRLHYLKVAIDEGDHALEHVAGLGEIRRVPRVSLSVDIFQGDLAAGLPIIRDEALGLVAREGGIRVLVVVQHVAAALEPDRRRSFDLLATLECEHRVTLRHVS